MSLYRKILGAFSKFMGKRVDFDGYYANQCVDWVKAYAKEIGHPVTTSGHAKDFAVKGLGPNWVRVKDISPGDIVVFTEGTYGHIAVVQKLIAKNLAVVEQNRDGKAYAKNSVKNQGSPVSVGYYRITGKEVYFRPKS